jgi:2-polyprenyl-3-methyl-5-hydroxy-6-metoxy-1,4-benzoquinol methylase
MFAENDDYADDYVSLDSLRQRMNEIVKPKLDWVLDVYRGHYGRAPANAIDVGAGGGHFVACCRENGLLAEGYELNQAACRFANKTFGVDLRREDFLAAPAKAGAFDLLTYWGLLEYTPEPAEFMAAARKHLNATNGMLIIEVPRADGLGTAIQAHRPNAVWRHLSPASHMNIYSDAAIATLLYDHGFAPIAAWYFGMDFYELLTQQADALADERILDTFAPMVPSMQEWLDAAQFDDDLIVAAIPADSVKS